MMVAFPAKPPEGVVGIKSNDKTADSANRNIGDEMAKLATTARDSCGEVHHRIHV
jgi:hypothetical protein